MDNETIRFVDVTATLFTNTPLFVFLVDPETPYSDEFTRNLTDWLHYGILFPFASMVAPCAKMKLKSGEWHLEQALSLEIRVSCPEAKSNHGSWVLVLLGHGVDKEGTIAKVRWYTEKK